MRKALILILFTALHLMSYGQKEEDYYKILRVPLPEGVVLEAGGVCSLPNGEIAVSTRRGDIYIIENPLGAKPVFRKFATGMHEILGLRYYNSAFYCAQRSELTKVTDRNGDGYADRYETVFSWPLSGNYHEYSFGPVIDDKGNMFVTLNVGFFNPDWWRGRSNAPWRGWTLKISENGDVEPFATGMRSPAGIGIIDGEFFYADNQGDWIGSGGLVHVQKGDFTGHPAGLAWADSTISPVNVSLEDVYDVVDPRFASEGESPKQPNNIEDEPIVPFFSLKDQYESIKAPAVWLPHGVLGISTSEIITDNTGGDFGPFEGQVFIGDQGQSKITRVFLEKVKGEYQGAAFGFREGFSSGVLRMAWASDNSLFVGQTNRGWGSTGQEPYALERLVWTGKIPFEMKCISARADGFEIEFTEAVDIKSAGNPENYQVSNFIYKYHPVYGSPAVDQQELKINGIEILEDGMKVRIAMDGLKERYIHEIIVNVTNSEGEALLHSTGYYTLNNIPEGDKMELKETKIQKAPTAKKVKKPVSKTLAKPAKRTTTMPAGWGNVDQTVQVRAKPGLKYDIEKIEVKAGQKIRIDFINPDDMPHNFLIVMPGQGNKVGEAALKLGIKGTELNYVPDMEEVIYHTKLLQPGEKESIYIIAPQNPGNYTYVCTYPGHYISMRGTLVVK